MTKRPSLIGKGHQALGTELRLVPSSPESDVAPAPSAPIPFPKTAMRPKPDRKSAMPRQTAASALSDLPGAGELRSHDAASLIAELIAFANARLNHNIETAIQLGHCRRPEDVLKLQADYFATLGQQFVAESVKLLSLWRW